MTVMLMMFAVSIVSLKVSAKPYEIIPQELSFLRKQNVPLPKVCFKQRHIARNRKRNSYELRQTKCDSCNEPMFTSIALGGGDVIYCESCYEKVID